MMQIKMIRGERGSDDGVSVLFYKQDETYDVGVDLGSAFVKSGAAERISGDEVLTDEAKDGTPAAAPINTKDQGGAPENKDLGKAPSNKSGGKLKAGDQVYLPGKLYEVGGVVSIAAAQTPGGEVGLLPVDQLPESERQALITEGKLTADGKIAA